MNSLVAAIASLIIPGLGQTLSGKVVRGAVIFIALLLIVIILFVSVIGIPFIIFVEPLIHIVAAYDAYKIASA